MISNKYKLSVIYLKHGPYLYLGTKWMLRQKRHKEGNPEKGFVIMLPKECKIWATHYISHDVKVATLQMVKHLILQLS